MKPYLKANETVSISTLVESLENSLKYKNTFAILATCFTIPDILSKTDINCNANNNKDRYIQWVKNYLPFELIKMENIDDCNVKELCLKEDLFYQLRNSFLHAGNSTICHDVEIPFDKIEFVCDYDGFLGPCSIEVVTEDNSYKVSMNESKINLIHTNNLKIVTTKIKIYVNCLAKIFINVLKSY